MDTVVNIRATIFRYALHPPTTTPRNTMMGSTALVSIKWSPEFALLPLAGTRRSGLEFLHRPQRSPDIRLQARARNRNLTNSG